jgi:hypothetical protein
VLGPHAIAQEGGRARLVFASLIFLFLFLPDIVIEEVVERALYLPASQPIR